MKPDLDPLYNSIMDGIRARLPMYFFYNIRIKCEKLVNKLYSCIPEGAVRLNCSVRVLCWGLMLGTG